MNNLFLRAVKSTAPNFWFLHVNSYVNLSQGFPPAAKHLEPLVFGAEATSICGECCIFWFEFLILFLTPVSCLIRCVDYFVISTFLDMASNSLSTILEKH